MTKDELITLVRKSRISHLADQIVPRIKPSIRLRAEPAELSGIPLGATRLGGVPDLPPSVDWPRNDETPLAFIAQVSLADVTELDRERVLPSSGWLCFFYDAINQPAGYDPEHRNGWRVLHFDAATGSLRRAPARPSERCVFESCTVTAEAEDTLPDTSALITEGVLEHMSDDFHAYFEFVDEYAGSDAGCRHRLLGNPDVIQGEMRRSCQFASNGLYCGDPSVYDDPRADVLARGAGEWILLLQVDSDEGGPGWMWGDCGRLYCWIRKQDLAQRDFDHVWVILQCF